MSELPASTPESGALSKDLKKRDFKFIGTTICYAFLQAVGLSKKRGLGSKNPHMWGFLLPKNPIFAAQAARKGTFWTACGLFLLQGNCFSKQNSGITK
jgi:hypothetical protein